MHHYLLYLIYLHLAMHCYYILILIVIKDLFNVRSKSINFYPILILLYLQEDQNTLIFQDHLYCIVTRENAYPSKK